MAEAPRRFWGPTKTIQVTRWSSHANYTCCMRLKSEHQLSASQGTLASELVTRLDKKQAKHALPCGCLYTIPGPRAEGQENDLLSTNRLQSNDLFCAGGLERNTLKTGSTQTVPKTLEQHHFSSKGKALSGALARLGCNKGETCTYGQLPTRNLETPRNKMFTGRVSPGLRTGGFMVTVLSTGIARQSWRNRMRELSRARCCWSSPRRDPELPARLNRPGAEFATRAATHTELHKAVAGRATAKQAGAFLQLSPNWH